MDYAEHIRELCRTARLDEAIRSLGFICQQGLPVSTDVVCCIIHCCSKKEDPAAAWQLHSILSRGRLDTLAVVGDHLIRLFAACGCLQGAISAFHSVTKPTIYTWNAVIAAHSKLGESANALDLYRKMQQEGEMPDKFTFLPVLKACGSLGAIVEGRLVHDQINRGHLESDTAIGNALVDMYTKCGSLEEGHRLFGMLPNQDLVSWGAMIAGYAQHGLGCLALELFQIMQQKGFQPNRIIFSCVLKACGNIGDLENGRFLHKQIISSGLQLDVGMGNHLIDMYVKCGSLEEGLKALVSWPVRNVVSWGTLISGFTHCGDGITALKLFEWMQKDNINPDRVIFLSTLKACGSIKALVQGRQIHDLGIRMALSSDVGFMGAVVDMYAKCDSLEEAARILEVMKCRDVVSWGSVMASYAQLDDGHGALELFEKMQHEGIEPDRFIYSCILKACGTIGALQQGRAIHDQIIRTSCQIDGVIGSTLVDMYAKCGSLVEAWESLQKVPAQDVVCWNAMIAGFTHHCHYKMVEQCLQEMQICGLEPDRTTYVSILAACSHAGKVEDGRWYFKSMMDNDIIANAEHFNCMIDLLGRAGQVNDAVELLKAMPAPPNVTGWTSLLASCRSHGNLDLGKQCFDKTLKLDPDNAAAYIILSNLCADTDMWPAVQNLHEMRKGASAWKKPGKAWIESDNKVHQFIAGDRYHPLIDVVCAKVQVLKGKMEQEGYIPQVDLVLEQMSV